MDNQFNGFDPQQGAMSGRDAEGYKLLPEGVTVTKAEYRKEYAPEQFYKTIKSMCIVLYIFLGISAVLSFIGNPFALIEIVAVAGLTVGVHLTKNKGCVIAILVYSCISCVLGLLTSGTPSAIIWIILSINMLLNINKVDKHYNEVMARCSIPAHGEWGV